MKLLKTIFKKPTLPKVALVKENEIIINGNELKKFACDFADEREMRGYERGKRDKKKEMERTYLKIHKDISNVDGELKSLVTLIATELLDQGDKEACLSILKTIIKARKMEGAYEL